jgi:hypothetical protein
VDLETVCAITLTPAGRAASARDAAGSGLELQSGAGVVSGPRLAGDLRWWCRLRWRSDRVKDLELHGLVTTADGVSIVLTAHGRETRDGAIACLPAFEAQDERYRWLNALLLIGRGRFDPSSGQTTLDVHIAT